MKSLIAFFLSVFLCSSLSAATLVLPPEAESQDATFASDFPFSRVNNIRSQQIYSPSLFPVLPVPGQYYQITGLALRLDGGGPDPFGRTVSFTRVQVLISNGNGPYTLSIDENHGPKVVTVYDAPTTFTSTVPPGTGPAEFDLNMSFSSPFPYSRSGDLVVEIRKFGGSTGFDVLPVLDAAQDSRFRFYYGSVDGIFTDTYVDIGLVTNFKFEIVPEPPIGALAGVALLFPFLKRLCRFFQH